jgi:hypothetical protein
MTTTTKEAAENALWHALQERRDRLRELRLWSGRSQQQHQKFYDSHGAGTLIVDLVAVLRRRARRTGGNIIQLKAMAQMVKHGLLWEQVAIREDENWSDYFKSPQVREGADRAIEAAKEWGEWH